ncbi:hypothetical protein IQ277_27010 [Nostocales cyanobacterium LEGE 12452]|nr:hypothetical protein [Nostocales cyanobacterium LEGE 12452]
MSTTNYTYTANFVYVCIHYAIALKIALEQNWVAQKISVIHSWANSKLIVQIAKQ